MRLGLWVADAERRLGADHHIFARHGFERLAQHRLGAVGGGGVEDVDPVIERRVNNADRVGLGFAGAEPEAAEPAATEPGDADLEPGLSERGVFHDRPAFSKAPFGTDRRHRRSRPLQVPDLGY